MVEDDRLPGVQEDSGDGLEGQEGHGRSPNSRDNTFSVASELNSTSRRHLSRRRVCQELSNAQLDVVRSVLTLAAEQAIHAHQSPLADVI